jgi:tetratricopeptide (TPR) repeat protein
VQRYGVREVERLLRLPRSTVRALIRAGFVTPSRGPRRSWQFSFQDLIVLRTAQALSDARVPKQRITRSVRELRRRLPASMPLSGLSICAVADRVVVREGKSRWQAESGQYLLEFDGDPADGSLSVIERPPSTEPETAGQWFDVAAALEGVDPEAAIEAYRRAAAADPRSPDAWINLGSLLHEAGRAAEAEAVYREALGRCGSDPLLLYNFGVLLDDRGRKEEALATYRKALGADPTLADCHYNIALLCESLDRPREAIRHMAEYRRLAGSKGGSPSRR